MENPRTLRFQSAEWASLVSDTSITVLGAGGIGSFLCQWLARQQPNEIAIYDHDYFEMNNAGSQFMTTDNLDQNKAEASAENAIRFSNYMNCYDMGKYEPDIGEPDENFLYEYVFSGFDNMKYRKMAFENWVKNPHSLLFIDGRLLAESFEIFTIKYGDEKSMRLYSDKHLFDDSEVEELACTLKATTHCGAMIASMMVGMYNNFLTNLYYKEQVRDLPFHIVYDMALVNLEILDK